MQIAEKMKQANALLTEKDRKINEMVEGMKRLKSMYSNHEGIEKMQNREVKMTALLSQKDKELASLKAELNSVKNSSSSRSFLVKLQAEAENHNKTKKEYEHLKNAYMQMSTYLEKLKREQLSNIAPSPTTQLAHSQSNSDQGVAESIDSTQENQSKPVVAENFDMNAFANLNLSKVPMNVVKVFKEQIIQYFLVY